MRYKSISPDFFVQNREKLARKMKPGHIAIFFSGSLQGQNADFHQPFVPDSNFFYLTGIDQEDMILFLFPDAPKPEWREMIFLPVFSKFMRQLEGWKYTAKDANRASGVQTVRDSKLFDRQLIASLPFCEGVYLDISEHEGRRKVFQSVAHSFAKRINREFPGHQLQRAAPLLRQLRTTKQKEEIQQIRIAASITGKAFDRAAAFVRPGVWEFEIEAEIQHEFLRNRASGPAFPPIVASGKNSCVLHYTANHEQCKPGELLQLDIGADYGHYSADVSRVVPVDGRFSPRHKAVYEAVLRLLRFGMDFLRPGVLLDEQQKAVGKEVERELVDLGLLTVKDIEKQAPESPLYKQYFMHGVSHHLGLDTHDFCDRYAPMAPGMVLTVEPGIYLPKEGFGIRLENDILITEDGYTDLTAAIPLEVEEIEDLMNG